MVPAHFHSIPEHEVRRLSPTNAKHLSEKLAEAIFYKQLLCHPPIHWIDVRGNVRITVTGSKDLSLNNLGKSACLLFRLLR